jgi:WD40 repeat protein
MLCSPSLLQRVLFARSDRVKSVDFHPTEPHVIACVALFRPVGSQRERSPPSPRSSFSPKLWRATRAAEMRPMPGAVCRLALACPTSIWPLTVCASRAPRRHLSERVPTSPLTSGLYNGSVNIWNYATGVLVRTFEVTDVPVRCVKYIARKNWFVAGKSPFEPPSSGARRSAAKGPFALGQLADRPLRLPLPASALRLLCPALYPLALSAASCSPPALGPGPPFVASRVLVLSPVSTALALNRLG